MPPVGLTLAEAGSYVYNQRRACHEKYVAGPSYMLCFLKEPPDACKRQIIGRIAEVKMTCDNRTAKECKGATKSVKD